jgi:hypothetical protein
MIAVDKRIVRVSRPQKEVRMLSLQDCLALSELTEDEILAIAEHENIPEIAALELGNTLEQTPEGERRIEEMIADDIAAAQRCGNVRHSALLKRVLQQYIARHHLQ